MNHGRAVLPALADTRGLGRALAADLRAGDVVILSGPLGAGKTALTGGLAEGLGVRGRVTSPTFVIAREYRSGTGGPNLVHVDLYRLGGDLAELDSLDLDTEIEDAVVVVEWGEGVAETLGARTLLVRLERAVDSDVRTATWEWLGTVGERPASTRLDA